jgi:mono/diheme cytochrome c family protein
MRRAFAITFLTVSLSLFLAIAVCSPESSRAQASAAEKTSVKVQAGQDVFNQKCLPCHSINEGQVSFGPSLYGEMAKSHPKKRAAEVREIIKNGKGKMPSFNDKLTQQDTDDLLVYLHTL